MGILMGCVSVLASQKMDTLLVGFMMLFLFVFQLTLGTYSWVYLGKVACDEGLSIGVGILWGSVLILSLVTNTMFDKLGNWGTFMFFAVCSLLSAVFFFFFLKETQGLSREECQVLYAPESAVKSDGKKTHDVLETEEEFNEELIDSRKKSSEGDIKYSIGGTVSTESQIV